MKEPVLYDPETDTLLVEIRPWPAASAAEINEEVGGEEADEGLVVYFGPDGKPTLTRSSMPPLARSWSPERRMRYAPPQAIWGVRRVLAPPLAVESV
jgi:hypothetical protein